MKNVMGVATLMIVPIFAAERAASAVSDNGKRAEEVIKGFQAISAKTEFCTPSFWAWELQLAIARKDQELAKRIARVLYGLNSAAATELMATCWISFRCGGNAA